MTFVSVSPDLNLSARLDGGLRDNYTRHATMISCIFSVCLLYCTMQYNNLLQSEEFLQRYQFRTFQPSIHNQKGIDFVDIKLEKQNKEDI